MRSNIRNPLSVNRAVGSYWTPSLIVSGRSLERDLTLEDLLCWGIVGNDEDGGTEGHITEKIDISNVCTCANSTAVVYNNNVIRS